MNINVHLEKFEGPLPLLIYLIRKNEMDIYDIEIHKITEQYLEYIRVMKELNLEFAGDFVAMAATLIHIKSKMLLPQYDDKGEVIEEDPRQELVNRLLEYERFQTAGKELYNRALLGREVFARGFKVEETAVDPLIILDEGGLYALIGMYRRAIKNVKKNVHVVMSKTQSLASRILELRHHFIPGQRVRYDELIVGEEREAKPKWVITFMSILELGRLGFVSLFQNETFGPIHIDTKKEIERDVVTQVQELEAQAAVFETALAGPTSVISNVIAGEENSNEQMELTPFAGEAATDSEIEEAERQLVATEQHIENAHNAEESEKLMNELDAPAADGWKWGGGDPDPSPAL